VAKHLAKALDGFGQRFEARSKQAQDDSREQLALLKGAALKRALGETPALKELAANVSKLQETRGKELASRQKAVDTALRAMRKDLGQ
jgi:hypothetical protein